MLPDIRYLLEVGTDIPETLKRAGLDGCIPRSRFVAVLSLFDGDRERYSDAFDLLLATLQDRTLEHVPDLRRP